MTEGGVAMPWYQRAPLGVFTTGAVVLFGLVALILARAGDEKFEHLHLLLDGSNGLLSLLLVLFLLAEQYQMDRLERRRLAISFALAALTETLHALVGIEWIGVMSWLQTYSMTIRPATWPPSAYVLPVGLLWSALIKARRHEVSTGQFALGMLALTCLLYVLSFNLPKYVDTGILGVQRPTQVPLLAVLAVVVMVYWRNRQRHALYAGVAYMSGMLFLSDLCMLYSTSPHEKFTMMAHSGKALAYVLMHLIMMRVAAQDAWARTVAEGQLVEARDRAEAANRSKSTFLATMSHEIRTPLNGVLGMAQLLLVPNLSESQRMEYARTVLHSGKLLLTLLNDLLDISKIEAGKFVLNPEPSTVEQIAGEIATLFSESARAKGLALAWQWQGEEGARFHLDATRLRQMLSNLISNAIKFTESGSVAVEIRELERVGDNVTLEFSVTDTGIGIPPEQQKQLFAPFVQADSAIAARFGGTGLGLSIVRRLAELMGGKAGVRSALGSGSCFWFTISAQSLAPDLDTRSSARQAPVPPETTGGEISPVGSVLVQEQVGVVPTQGVASSSARRRVLVVDDNAINRSVAQALLAQLGLEVYTVDDGSKAVSVVKRGLRPGLVLMDVQMPGMDGIEATRQIRAWEQESEGIPRTVIIALTAGAFESDVSQCLAAGMDDFMAKPLDFQILRGKLSERLGW